MKPHQSSNKIYSRHAHWKATDDKICIKRLQDIPRHKTVVNAGVLVLLKLG